jgi:hypothetical protein
VEYRNFRNCIYFLGNGSGHDGEGNYPPGGCYHGILKATESTISAILGLRLRYGKVDAVTMSG